MLPCPGPNVIPFDQQQESTNRILGAMESIVPSSQEDACEYTLLLLRDQLPFLRRESRAVKAVNVFSRQVLYIYAYDSQ